MKALTEEYKQKIRNNYPMNWYHAMTLPENMHKHLSFMERNSEHGFTYEAVFFSPKGFDIYEKDGETRIFCVQNSLFETHPLSKEDGEGDWQQWLKEANKIKEIR